MDYTGEDRKTFSQAGLFSLSGDLAMVPKSRKFLLWLVVGLSFNAAACASAPYTGRRQLFLVPDSAVASMGSSAFLSIKKSYRVSQDPGANELVARVGRRLAAAAHRPDFRWDFAVFQDDKIANAFCLPGGKVGVFTGIFKYTQDETGLATVISHEAAHALARHAGERLSHALLAQAGGIGLGAALGGMSPYAGQAVMQAYGLGAQVGVLLPYSRAQEYEADQVGLILMAKAGYDPGAAVVFWERMKTMQKDKTRPPQFLSSHPSDDSRLKAMTAFLPTARQHFVPHPWMSQELGKDWRGSRALLSSSPDPLWWGRMVGGGPGK
jgi:predicted Zn-dependent protease